MDNLFASIDLSHSHVQCSLSKHKNKLLQSENIVAELVEAESHFAVIDVVHTTPSVLRPFDSLNKLQFQFGLMRCLCMQTAIC